MRLDTNELIQRAEQQLADGDRSARKTLARARLALLKQRDTEGLEHLLELAGRLDKPAGLTYTIQQDLRLIEWQGKNTSRTSKSGWGDFAAVLAAVVGAAAGAVVGVALTAPILSGTEPHGLVYLAGWIFFGSIGAALGAGLAYGFWRLYRAANTDD